MLIDWIWVLIGAAVMLISIKKTDVSSTPMGGSRLLYRALTSVSRELRFQAPRVLLGRRSIHEVAILAASLNMRTASLA